MASNELLSTKDLNCEIVPSDIPFDFSDKTRFRKVEFPEQTGVTANSLLQLLPPSHCFRYCFQNLYFEISRRCPGSALASSQRRLCHDCG